VLIAVPKALLTLIRHFDEIPNQVSSNNSRVCGEHSIAGGDFGMILLMLLALLAIIAFGLGFTIKWLFIVAVVLALVWLISLLAGGIGGRSRGAWW
jgi:hypothetical protein